MINDVFVDCKISALFLSLSIRRDLGSTPFAYRNKNILATIFVMKKHQIFKSKVKHRQREKHASKEECIK